MCTRTPCTPLVLNSGSYALSRYADPAAVAVRAQGSHRAPRPGSALSGWVTLSTPPSPCGLTLPDHLLHGENSVCPPHQGQPSPSTISHVDDISPRGGLPGRWKSREAHSLRGEGETWARNRTGKADVSRQDPCVRNRREAGQGGPFLVLVLRGVAEKQRRGHQPVSRTTM